MIQAQQIAPAQLDISAMAGVAASIGRITDYGNERSRAANLTIVTAAPVAAVRRAPTLKAKPAGMDGPAGPTA